jgi:hypothetical protein
VDEIRDEQNLRSPLFVQPSRNCEARSGDREFYAVVQNAFGIPPHRLLLIDDTPKNTEGARNAGWQGLPYGDYSRGQSGNASELTKALGLA